MATREDRIKAALEKEQELLGRYKKEKEKRQELEKRARAVERAADRKERTRRLIKIGGAVESHFGTLVDFGAFDVWLTSQERYAKGFTPKDSQKPPEASVSSVERRNEGFSQ